MTLKFKEFCFEVFIGGAIQSKEEAAIRNNQRDPTNRLANLTW